MIYLSILSVSFCFHQGPFNDFPTLLEDFESEKLIYSTTTKTKTDFENSSIMSLKGKVAIVTGANGAIGYEISKGLAKLQAKVVMVCRDQQRGKQSVDRVIEETQNPDIHLELVDLSEKQPIIDFAKRFEQKYGRLDLLVNNAAVSPNNRKLNSQGQELTFATNVLSYVFMTLALKDLLVKSAPSRVVNVASNYAGDLRLDDVNFSKRSYNTNSAYRQSKQCNRMLTYSMVENMFNDNNTNNNLVVVNACHPGVVTSPLLKGLGMTSGFDSASQGAETPLFLATNPTTATVTGEYWYNSSLSRCQFKNMKKERDDLWNYCVNLWNQ